MKIFISYSVRDAHKVLGIAEWLKKEHDAEVHWWESSQRPGKEAWGQIFQWIEQANLVIVVVSGNVLHRAMAVGNEIGFAKAKGKLIIPLVLEPPGWRARLVRSLGARVGIGADDLGCIGDLVHIRINERAPEEGMLKLDNELRHLAAEQTSKEIRDALLAVAGLIAVGGLFAKS